MCPCPCHPTVVMSVLCKGFHSGEHGHHMGIHCNVACASIEIQIICNLFWALEAICHWILVAAQYCCLIKKYGYTVEYWIFKTAQKGYRHRGLQWKQFHPYPLPFIFSEGSDVSLAPQQITIHDMVKSINVGRGWCQHSKSVWIITSATDCCIVLGLFMGSTVNEFHQEEGWYQFGSQ